MHRFDGFLVSTSQRTLQIQSSTDVIKKKKNNQKMMGKFRFSVSLCTMAFFHCLTPNPNGKNCDIWFALNIFREQCQSIISHSHWLHLILCKYNAVFSFFHRKFPLLNACSNAVYAGVQFLLQYSSPHNQSKYICVIFPSSRIISLSFSFLLYFFIHKCVVWMKLSFEYK